MSVGRPRSFDLDLALDRALNVFWRKGYEGTSLPDLTKAMRINRPSLYAAFGNKEALFHKVVERYAAGPAAYFDAALQQPTARAVAEHVFRGGIDLVTDRRNPGGCLAVHGALVCGDDADPIRRALAARRKARQVSLRRRFQRAQAEGDLPPSASPADLARYVTSVLYGMAVQAAGGATRAELKRVARIAMRAWPK